MGTRGALAALLVLVLAPIGCGGSDDGRGPDPATLVLDFQPNAVHTGIYTALERGLFGDRGVDLTVREPTASSDGPKLLEAGRAEFAILDIHDLGIARERGFEVVGIAAVVSRPLAAVIAGDPGHVERPCDLAGGAVGVTGLPSDDAVLDSVLAADGCEPGVVERVTIGFNAVAALAGGRVDAATGFWNAEGVALERLGTPVRVFRVEDYGAPRYPELVLATTRDLLAERPEFARSVVAAMDDGYAIVRRDPRGALDDLLGAVDGLDAEQQRAQLDALLDAGALPATRLDAAALRAWARWDADHGILASAPAVGAAFELPREQPAG